MNRLRALRKQARLSLRELESRVGISNVVISYLENGKRPFRQDHIIKFTAFFSVTSDFLLGRSDYGYVVFPQFGDEEITLTESEYARLSPHITVSIVTTGKNTTILSVDTPKEEQSLAIPQSMVYRELKGSVSDYDMKDVLESKLDDLKSHMTSEELAKVIRFIEDYIIS